MFLNIITILTQYKLQRRWRCQHRLLLTLWLLLSTWFWLRIWVTIPAKHWLTVKPMHHARVLRNNEFVSYCATIIATICPIHASPDGKWYVTWDTWHRRSVAQPDSNRIYFDTRLTFEESSQRVFLLLTLTKLGLGGKNRTCATCSQSTDDTISLHREKLLVPLDRIELPHPDYKTGPLPLRIKGLKITGSTFFLNNRKFFELLNWS